MSRLFQSNKAPDQPVDERSRLLSRFPDQTTLSMQCTTVLYYVFPLLRLPALRMGEGMGSLVFAKYGYREGYRDYFCQR